MAFVKSIALVAASSQYLTAADSASLSVTGDCTVEFWVKPNDLLKPIYTKGTGTLNQSYGAFFDTGSSGIEWFISKLGNNITNTTDVVFGSFTAGIWTHIAIVYNSVAATVELFKNGVSIASSSGTQTSIWDGTSLFRMGANGDQNSFMDGKFVEFRVWGTTRTQAQIAANMWSQLVGNESGLNALWSLNNTLNDSTSNSNTLTAVNSPSYSTDVPVQSSFPPRVMKFQAVNRASNY